MYQRILLAYDGSESGQKALLGCQEIAQWSHAEMYLIAVMPSPAVYIAVDGGFYDSGRDEEDKQRFRAILDDGLRRLKEAGHTAKGEMLVGDAVQEITEYAKKIMPISSSSATSISKAGRRAGGEVRPRRR